MATLDTVFMVILLLSMVLGAWRGLAREVIAWLSWVAAFIAAQWFAPNMAASLPLGGLGEPLRYGAGFVVVFVAALFAGGLVGRLLSGLLSAVGLGPVDRLLGALFGLLRGAVLLLSAVVVVGLTPWNQSEAWRGATGVRWAQSALAVIKPLMPREFGKYLPNL